MKQCLSCFSHSSPPVIHHRRRVCSHCDVTLRRDHFVTHQLPPSCSISHNDKRRPISLPDHVSALRCIHLYCHGNCCQRRPAFPRCYLHRLARLCLLMAAWSMSIDEGEHGYDECQAEIKEKEAEVLVLCWGWCD